MIIALFRRGLEMVLEEEDDIDLVGRRVTAPRRSLWPRVAADVVLMDIRMPKITGIEACRAMKRSPRARRSSY